MGRVRRNSTLRVAASALLLSLCTAGALAETPATTPADRLTPLPAPIVALPRLTPGQPLSPPLTPGVVWEHPPDAPAPLSPPGPRPAPAGPGADRTPVPPPAVKPPDAKPAEPPPAVAPPPLPPPLPLVKPPGDVALQPAPAAPPEKPPAEKPVTVEPPAKPTPKPPATAPARRGVTATAGIYLRATPDANGRVLDTVEKGEQVTAFGPPVDGWQRVGRDGKPQGYVAAEYLADATPTHTASTTAPKPGRYAKADPEDRGCALPDDLPERAQRPRLPGGTVARLRAAANLRVAPVCDAKVLDVLDEGERVTVLEAAGGWYKVGRKGKALGYVGAALLAPLRR
ncbi:SH3 domain-containing protein [Azospirillum oryzae]|uniref:SH3 domain-containing protein n=1 Tax=Azospirillum oryzae TaxID=286727 RepID=A0A1X7G6L3_9PROT|nr:SH3 domain-containing protein [Azospirillum oryzae]SMF64981.1 SH3 domain-containing protein [Azospirillum oryzae]